MRSNATSTTANAEKTSAQPARIGLRANHGHTRRKARPAAAAFIILPVAVLVLTGCMTGFAHNADGSPILFGNAATPSATPTPEPIAGDLDGNGKLSEFEKQVLAQNAPHNYVLPDGSSVPVSPDQPLPASVVEALVASATPKVNTMKTKSGPENLRAFGSIKDQLDAASAATGKRIIYVYQTTNVNTDRSVTVVWAASSSSGTGNTGVAPSTNRDSVVRGAQTVVSNSGNAGVIVIE